MITPTPLSDAIANAIGVFFSGSAFARIATSTYTQIKAALGVLFGGSVNTGGTSSTLSLFDGISAPATISIATPGVVTWAGHPFYPFVSGSVVKFTTTGALPSGLTAGTAVYPSSVGLTADTFQVADTAAHALAGTNSIDTSGSQSGVHTAWDVSRPIGTYPTTAQGTIPAASIGTQFERGLIAISADGGGAADLTVNYL